MRGSIDCKMKPEGSIGVHRDGKGWIERVHGGDGGVEGTKRSVEVAYNKKGCRGVEWRQYRDAWGMRAWE